MIKLEQFQNIQIKCTCSWHLEAVSVMMQFMSYRKHSNTVILNVMKMSMYSFFEININPLTFTLLKNQKWLAFANNIEPAQPAYPCNWTRFNTEGWSNFKLLDNYKIDSQHPKIGSWKKWANHYKKFSRLKGLILDISVAINEQFYTSVDHHFDILWYWYFV